MSLKKKLLLLGTAALAAFAPLKSKSAEPAPSDVRQEQLDAVLRTAMNANMDVSVVKDEAAKYMEFPSCLPVTKDGQFDAAKCQQWMKDLNLEENLPHIKKCAKAIQDGASPEKAFAEFSKDVSAGDKDKEQKLMRLTPALNAILDEFPDRTGKGLYIAAGVLLALAGMGVVVAKKFHDGGDPLSIFVLSAVGVGLAAIGFTTRTTDADRLKFLQDNIPKVYQYAYNNYVNQTIATEKVKIVRMDAQQAAQMIEFSKNNQAQQNSQQSSAPSRDGR